MLWVFVKKVERRKQLHFGKFDEGFYNVTQTTLHSLVD
jgi:hypothetical protein